MLTLQQRRELAGATADMGGAVHMQAQQGPGTTQAQGGVAMRALVRREGVTHPEEAMGSAVPLR